MTRVFAILTVAACCVAASVPAGAQQTRNKDLWATVNICNTAAHPNMMGVRGSMPGDGNRTQMYMRFTAQYYNISKQAWQTAGGPTKWISVGSGDFARRQAGYTFDFGTPQGTTAYTMRGLVDFKWTKSSRIVRTAQQVTKAHHPNTVGADPRSYSAALCKVTY